MVFGWLIFFCFWVSSVSSFFFFVFGCFGFMVVGSCIGCSLVGSGRVRVGGVFWCSGRLFFFRCVVVGSLFVVGWGGVLFR